MEVVSSSTSLEIPGYRILKKINQGGMSTVYLAIQRSVGRQVALKVMSPVLNADPVFSERFQREANIVGQLSHPNIVGIHDIGRYRSLNYIAMDFMPGGSVADRLAQGTIDPLEALNVTRQIALALDHAHGKGYVHRDLKPENILFREDGSAVLTDFGVARAVARTTRMTNTGMVVGTPHYMSPEQARGVAIDGRADLYSLGVVFYEMLAGAVPYQAEEAVAIAIKHLTDPIPRLPARHSLYQGLIDRFLAKDPEHRFQRGLDVVDAIDQLLAALAGMPAAPTTQLNNTSVRISSLLRALVMTLYGTLSDKLAASWARFRDQPLHRDQSRAEQKTLLRAQQLLRPAQTLPARPRALYTGFIGVSLLLCWVLFSLISHKLQWQSDSELLNGATALTARLLLPAEQAVEPLAESEQTAAAPVPVAEADLEPAAAPPPEAETPPASDPLETLIEAETSAKTEEVAELTAAPGSSIAADAEAEIETAGTSPIEEETTPELQPVRYRLTVDPQPADARVRIMNIAPRYRSGMALEAGNYDLEVSKPGYDTLRRWVAIEDSDLVIPARLQRTYYPGRKLRSPLAAGGRGPQMVVLRTGSFTMGDNKYPNSSPAHRVNIRNAFAISTHEITFDEYDRFAQDTGAALPGDAGWGRGNRPVINVSWQDAQEYAAWLSRQTGRKYRLPTEAEWEYAARGGIQQAFWWGGQDARGKANCRRGCASEFNTLFAASSAPAGHYPANPFGLHDTSGNVAEWVEDCYLGDYRSNRSDGRARTIASCELRALRGGSMRDPVQNIRSDYRTGLHESTLSREVGFRVVMEL